MFPGCFFFTGYGLVSYRTDRGNAFPCPIHRNKNPVKEGYYFRNRIKDKKRCRRWDLNPHDIATTGT